MEKSNSIINSVKRLERIGQENSKTVQKLKEATEDVAQKLLELILEVIDWEEASSFYANIHNQLIIPIVDKLWIIESEHGIDLIYDYNSSSNSFNFLYYSITKNVRRTTALNFSRAIANGLLNDVYEWINKKKIALNIEEVNNDK